MNWLNCNGRMGIRLAGFFSVLFLSCLVCRPSQAAAFQSRITFTVTLHDFEGLPQAGVDVRLVTPDAATTLAHGTTDATGTVRFTDVAPREIRVVIEGQTAQGIALKQLGEDATGIWARLPNEDWILLLLADVDGAVFPDLAMVAPDGGGATTAPSRSAGVPDVASPQAILSAAASFASTATPTNAPAVRTDAATAPLPVWLGLGIGAVLLGSSVMLLVVRRYL